MPLVRKRRAPAPEEAASDVSEVEQDGPRQTQRRRRSGASDHDEFTQVVAGASRQEGNTNQMVKNLVRLALACEYSRTPIRRTEINAKVLGVHTRQFKPVFGEAQSQLRTVFGMEMTELPIRDKVTLAQRRAAQKSQTSQKTSGAWVLTSTLPARFRTPDILTPAQAPTTEAESQYIALYTLVVSLIMLSGGSLPDGKLDRYLKRVNVDEVTPFANSAAYSGLDRTEKVLKRMEKDGYIIKIRDATAGEESIEWVVGPRGKVEVGETGTMGLVKAVYGDLDDADALELQRKTDRSLGLAEKKAQLAQPPKGNGRKRGPKPKSTAPAEGEEDGSSASDGSAEA